MPSGGSRKDSGRKWKWGEPSTKVGVPLSISNDLIRMMEQLWEKGIRGKELIDALNSFEYRRVKKYDYPVSAQVDLILAVSGVGWANFTL